MWMNVTDLHESVAVLHEGSSGDAFEALADVRQVLRLQNHILMMVDQSQGHTEHDLRTLVEQTVPDPQNRLTEPKHRISREPINHMITLGCSITSTGRMSMNRQMNQRETTRVHMTP